MSEMVKAIYSSGEYRLVESLAHKLVDRYEWTTFSPEQRRAKVHDVLSLSLPVDDKVEKDKLLPLKFEEIGMIPNMPSSTFRRIWNYAIFLKKHANIVEVNESKTGLYYDDKHFEVSEDLKYIFQFFSQFSHQGTLVRKFMYFLSLRRFTKKSVNR